MAGEQRDEKDDQTDDPGDQLDAEADDAFVGGLMVRGEAARPVEGKLPPGATHEIVEDDEGNTVVRRRRFSAF